MNRLARTLTVASALSLVLLLSNCSSFDPTDILDGFTAQKKPLPGERKPLFPSGTPGVSQGLPPELVKGYQPATDATQDAQAAPAPPAPTPTKPKPKPKPKVATAPADPSRAPPAATGASAATRPPQSSPWPDPPPSRQSAAPGQPAWPDPPASTVTR
jgi:hypothetical protein